MKLLLAQLYEVVDDSSSPSLILHLDRIRDSCPLLVATWHELLRIYGDPPVARGVSEYTLFDGRYQLEQGSMIMTLIHLHNFDRGIWGEDVNEFRPRRFLQENGQVAKDLVKHLNVFGLPGMHQCPGRHLGYTMTLSILAKALLSFDIIPAPGDALEKREGAEEKRDYAGVAGHESGP